ncbi:MAG: alpha-glucuronidase family glycosyl hydrolase [Acidobacteriota bacterium]
MNEIGHSTIPLSPDWEPLRGFRSLARLSCRVVFLILFAVSVAWSETRQPSSKVIPVVAAGKAEAAIVVGSTEPLRFAGAELQRYVELLTGVQLEIVDQNGANSRPAHEALILIGGPRLNAVTQKLSGVTQAGFGDLKRDGFVLRTGRLGARPVVLAGGNDESGTLYAVYELIEHWGVTFRLTGDIVPSRRESLSVPTLNLRREPAFPRRGFLLQASGFDNLTIFSKADYVRFIDQMAKMKCNYLQFWWFAFSPWLLHSYRGETMWMGDVSTKESGYLTWAHSSMGSRTTDDVTIGREHFRARRMAPPEFQNVESPEEAFDVARDLLKAVIEHARKRHIKVWPAIEMAALPPNLARFTERVGTLPFHPIFGTFAHPLDPVNREIQAERLKNLIRTYPDAEGYFLVLAELYPELNNEQHHDFFVRERPKFHEVRDLRAPWLDWGAGNSSDRIIDSAIGYLDLFRFLLGKGREFAPQAKLGVMGVGRGYLLPLMDKMLAREIPFTDLESSGVWTPAGLPMKYFGGMGERERILQQRIDDDVNMMGMQFSVRQYAEKDRIFTDGAKYGLSGHAGQVQRARGTETNSRYSAVAAWNPDLTPEAFYKDYATRLFGKNSAEPMCRAYLRLEENEAWLGYYNYGYSTMNCCGALPEVSLAYSYSRQDNAFDGPKTADWGPFVIKSPDVINRYQGAVRLLNQALDEMGKALPEVEPQGKYELNFMINRTESYRDYIQALITIRQAYLSFDRAFAKKNQVEYDVFVGELEQSLAGFDGAVEQVQEATRKFAKVIDHPSDLAVLYHLNLRAVLGFDLARRWIRNVVSFHQGKPYLEPVPFHKLFSTDIHFLQGGTL